MTCIRYPSWPTHYGYVKLPKAESAIFEPDSIPRNVTELDVSDIDVAIFEGGAIHHQLRNLIVNSINISSHYPKTVRLFTKSYACLPIPKNVTCYVHVNDTRNLDKTRPQYVFSEEPFPDAISCRVCSSELYVKTIPPCREAVMEAISKKASAMENLKKQVSLLEEEINSLEDLL